MCPTVGIPLTPPLGADGPAPSAMTMRTDRPILYVADGALPVIHVIDVADPTKPVEQQPLLATSLRAPGKPIAVGPLAVSPATRDGTVYLYATDMSDGTLMVFDVTDPASTVRTPLLRPHPELNPFQPLDRIAFSAPVASVIFVEHDWQLPSQADNNHYYGGILCNPNPGAQPSSDSTKWAKGAFYRADQAGTIETNGTSRAFRSGCEASSALRPCRTATSSPSTSTTGTRHAVAPIPMVVGPTVVVPRDLLRLSRACSMYLRTRDAGRAASTTRPGLPGRWERYRGRHYRVLLPRVRAAQDTFELPPGQRSQHGQSRAQP